MGCHIGGDVDDANVDDADVDDNINDGVTL